MARAGKYDLIKDFDIESDDGFVSTDPYWIIAVFRLGAPVSYSRAEARSSKTVTDGALLRAQKPLVITDDCLSISIMNSKSNHLKSMNATLKQTTVNYLVEILPGDYVLAWIMNNRNKQESVLQRLEASDPKNPCNQFDDGLKFVGRVDDVFKNTSVDPDSGIKMSSYALRCSGFQELDTQMYYDYALASSDVVKQDIGTYLARLGSSINRVFGQQTKGQIERDNVNRIIPELVDLIVGRGPKKSNVIAVNTQVKGTEGVTHNTPTPSADNDAPYAYLVPLSVGHVLGRTKEDQSLVADILSYAQLMEMTIGVQSYSARSGWSVFVPDINDNHAGAESNHSYTGIPMMGTFLPMMPDFANRPLWSVFQQYLNPSINELYTALKVNRSGLVVPMVTMRQIPFTTDAFVMPAEIKKRQPGDVNWASGEQGPLTAGQWLRTQESATSRSTPTTKFLDLPRWKIPATIVRSVNIGRSNSTRANFVHVYGQSSYLSEANVPIQAQMIRNPPIRDDLDIMRSGLRPYMMTVECWVDNQVGKVAGFWMALIADWTMGSQLTLNGQIELYGVQSPIAEGDNVEFDGVVYHIMSVNHSAQINPGTGDKGWVTQLAVCNGMRDVDTDQATVQPIYPGLSKADNTAFDPGLTAEHVVSTGGDSDTAVKWDDPEVLHERASKSRIADYSAVDRGGDLEDVGRDPDVKKLL